MAGLFFCEKKQKDVTLSIKKCGLIEIRPVLSARGQPGTRRKPPAAQTGIPSADAPGRGKMTRGL